MCERLSRTYVNSRKMIISLLFIQVPANISVSGSSNICNIFIIIVVVAVVVTDNFISRKFLILLPQMNYVLHNSFIVRACCFSSRERSEEKRRKRRQNDWRTNVFPKLVSKMAIIRAHSVATSAIVSTLPDIPALPRPCLNLPKILNGASKLKKQTSE